MTIDDCHVIEIPRIDDERGSLSFLEINKQIPFSIKRIYYLYNLNSLPRGGHAHKKLKQIFIAINGSFCISLDDGKKKKTFTLNKPQVGLYLVPMIWRDLFNFASNTICLVLASDIYQETDYYRDYKEFIASIN